MQATNARFETRWSNGFWKVFNTRTFTDMSMHETKVQAEAAARISHAIFEQKRRPFRKV